MSVPPPTTNPPKLGKRDSSGTPIESSLASFCAHLIEACWLVAVGVVPLLLDPQAASRFFPIKMSVLNSLGIIVAGALVVRLADRSGGRRPVDSAWLTATAAILMTFAISTVLSVDPQNSLWGGYEFLQGSFALFCQLSLFVGVAVCLRTEKQVRRLVAMVLASSVPLALYALLQRFGWDPISLEPPLRKTVSFGGHASFVAGTLLLAMPLCAWKFLVALSAARSQKRALPVAGAVFFALLFLTQLSAVLATGKRGPFMGLVASAACATLLVAICRKKFRHAVVALALPVFAVLCLAVLALAGQQNPSLKKIPVLGRLSMVVPVGKGTGDVFRKAVWGRAPEIAMAGAPVVFPNGDTDDWWRIRPLVGYGPETLPALLPKHFFWGGAAPGSNIESRFHNSFWDTMQSAGLLAVAATFWLHTLIFARGLSSLPLKSASAKPWRLFAAGSMLGLLAGIAMEILLGKGFFGLGFPLGFACGLILWSMVVARQDPGPSPEILTPRTLLGIALLSAVVGNWVDMAFLFPTPNTSAVAWVCAGALVALGRFHGTDDAVVPSEVQSGRTSWLSAGLLHGVLAGGVLAALAHAFITASSPEPLTWGRVLANSFTQLRHSDAPSHLIFLLVIPTWLATNLLLGMDQLHMNRDRGFWKALIASGIASLVIAATWSVWKAIKLVAIGPLPKPTTSMDGIIRQTAGYETVSVGIVLLIIVLAMAAALLLGGKSQGMLHFRPRALALAATVIMLVACVSAIWMTQVPILLSEASGGWARRLENLNQNPAAARIYARALNYNPRDPFNRIQGATAYMAVAERCSDIGDCLRNMRQAESILTDGLKLNDRNVLHYFLGNVLMRQAMELPEGTEKTAVSERSRNALDAAIKYAPDTEVAWFDASLVERELFKNSQAAESKRISADEISSSWDPSVWGDQYAFQLASTANPILRKAYAWRGVGYFTKAIELAAGHPNSGLSRLIVAKGTLLVNLGESRQALDCLLEATKLGDSPEAWQAHAMLTEIYARLGDRDSAAAHVEEAIKLAPEPYHPKLLNLKLQVTR